MRKNTLRILVIVITLLLAVIMAAPVFAGNTGAIWTTNAAGNTVDQNLYDAKWDVYLNGGPHGNGQGLTPGAYYVKVTTPDGEILGKTLTASVAVDANGELPHVQLWDILFRASTGYAEKGFDNTTNPGGEYKVWVSQDPGFDGNKTDNFKVAVPSYPVPEVPTVLLFGLGLLGIGGFIVKSNLSKRAAVKN
jgi:hypothetical protein